jgi:zinc-ribbon domain
MSETALQEIVMALSCPRCGTSVPDEAMYCPYCSLPKPKRGFAAANEEPPAESMAPGTSQELPQPIARKTRRSVPVKTKKEPPTRSVRRTPSRPAKPPRTFRASVLSIAALAALLCVGLYIFVVPMVYSESAEPKVVLAALEKLRHQLSNEPEVTVDARLSRELETSRRVKNLVAYQGWTVRPIKGTKSKVVLAFSFEEVGGVRQSAEWIADLSNNTFAPQTELAETVSAK